MPPSCAWQKVEVQNQPPRYVNYVTGQTMHSLPDVSGMSKSMSQATHVLRDHVHP